MNMIETNNLLILTITNGSNISLIFQLMHTIYTLQKALKFTLKTLNTITIIVSLSL